MNGFFVLWKKEWTEAYRTSKLIWLPAVFAILGIMQPVTAKFMPDILQSAGSLPEGTVIQIPVPTPGEVMGQTLSQFGSVGLLAVCLAFMGMISGERRSGTAAWIMVKPVPHAAYAGAKWTVSVLVTLISYIVGYAASWYETIALIGTPDAGQVLAAGAAYGGWLIFVLSAVLAAGAWLNAPAAAAFVPFAGAVLLQLAYGFMPERLSLLPSALAAESSAALQAQRFPGVTGVAAVTAVLVLLLAGLAVWGVRSRPLRG